MTDICNICSTPLVDDGKQRKKKRPRRCDKCKMKKRLEKRNADPIKVLFHRWQSSAHKRWPSIDRTLLSTATVKLVWERYERKSVISGETDAKKLCIGCYGIVAPTVPTSVDQLVIITSAEAQRLSKIKVLEAHKAIFGPTFRVPTDASGIGEGEAAESGSSREDADGIAEGDAIPLKRFKLAAEEDE